MTQAKPKVDTASLWVAYKERGDMQAREQLIVQYVHLVKYVSGRLAMGLPPYVDADDLYSYGIFGLINAVERFDHMRGIKFETYAITRIKGSILDGLRAMDWVPSSLRQRAKEVEEAFSRVENRLGRSANDDEVAAELGMDLSSFHKIIKDMSRTRLLSLDELWQTGDGDEGEFALKDLLGDNNAEDPFQSVIVAEIKDSLANAIQNLPEKEKLVISLYYYDGLTAKEISQIMNLSVSRISQLHSKAILRLRGKLAKTSRA